MKLNHNQYIIIYHHIKSDGPRYALFQHENGNVFPKSILDKSDVKQIYKFPSHIFSPDQVQQAKERFANVADRDEFENVIKNNTVPLDEINKVISDNTYFYN